MVPQSSTMLAALKVGKNAMKASTDITGLASDSRAVQPGYLFAALSGTRDDGARFVDDAVAQLGGLDDADPAIVDREDSLGLLDLDGDLLDHRGFLFSIHLPPRRDFSHLTASGRARGLRWPRVGAQAAAAGALSSRMSRVRVGSTLTPGPIVVANTIVWM